MTHGDLGQNCEDCLRLSGPCSAMNEAEVAFEDRWLRARIVTAGMLAKACEAKLRKSKSSAEPVLQDPSLDGGSIETRIECGLTALTHCGLFPEQ